MYMRYSMLLTEIGKKISKFDSCGSELFLPMDKSRYFKIYHVRIYQTYFANLIQKNHT